MPYIPSRANQDNLAVKLSHVLCAPRQGKVRDSYALALHPDAMLVVASDRISIFDFVLGSLISDKGEILTAMTVLWLTRIFRGTKHHLLAYGSGIDAFLPPELRGNRELQTRALVVRRLNMVPVECIVRGYLTGSGWVAYQKTGEVCGCHLPSGLHDGSLLHSPMFTPTTKAESGHDEHLNAQQVIGQYGHELSDLSVNWYNLGWSYARRRGIIIADTKFEVGLSPDPRRELILGDEVLTPDSSRFWLERDYAEAAKNNKAPQGYDKQPVRDWGKTILTPFNNAAEDSIIGINRLNPEIHGHQQFVGTLQVPKDLAQLVSVRYHKIFQLLAGVQLKQFQATVMKTAQPANESAMVG